MSLPVFPATLRGPLREGFSHGYGDVRRMFSPEAGPLVPRARMSQVAEPVSLTLDLARAELAVFETFWLSDTRKGSLPFLMPDPMTDGWYLLDPQGEPMLLADGSPILLAKTWLCLFGEKPPVVTPAQRRTRFRVAVSISVMP